MKNLIRATLALALLGGTAAQAAAPCAPADPAVIAALRDVLARAPDLRIAGWAAYLNDDFYNDLACTLPQPVTPENVQGLDGGAAQLLEIGLQQDMTRNQSDALMMILSAMQSTQTKD